MDSLEQEDIFQINSGLPEMDLFFADRGRDFFWSEKITFIEVGTLDG
jgi:hypothetical protein